MPYMRVTQATFDPAKAQEYARIQREVGAVMQRQPGVQRFQSGLDAEGGRAIAITTFDTREHASFDRQQLGDVVNQVQAMGAQLSPAAIFEVAE
jgi:hypothetical protein